MYEIKFVFLLLICLESIWLVGQPKEPSDKERKFTFLNSFGIISRIFFAGKLPVPRTAAAEDSYCQPSDLRLWGSSESKSDDSPFSLSKFTLTKETICVTSFFGVATIVNLIWALLAFIVPFPPRDGHHFFFFFGSVVSFVLRRKIHRVEHRHK